MVANYAGTIRYTYAVYIQIWRTYIPGAPPPLPKKKKKKRNSRFLSRLRSKCETIGVTISGDGGRGGVNISG